MAARKKIKNIKDLREDLLNKYAGGIGPDNIDEIREITRLSSAIIRTARVELDYHKLKNKDKPPSIEFLET